MKTFDETVKTSKHLSVVEFFAPWCGYCKQFAPVYKAFANKVSNFVNVIAINCDDQENNQLYYDGARSITSLMDKTMGKIPDYIEKISGNINFFLDNNNETAKFLLFSLKKEPNGFIKTLSADFYNIIKFALIHESFKDAVEIFGITKFPTIVFLPGGNKEPIIYSGETTYKDIFSFLEKQVPLEKRTQSTETKDKLKESKDFTLVELDTINDFLEKCMLKYGISIIGISSSISEFDFLHKVAKKYTKFRYYYLNSSKSIVNMMLKTSGITFEGSKIILLNGQKGWYVELIGKYTVEQILESISKVMLGESIEKKKLNKEIIDLILKTKKTEL
ncbi:hypothetical protein PCK1_000241 [Pneumocystis canis]|nr:hypothetical protein PCK1_000241 [Pneumocystis canis]